MIPARGGSTRFGNKPLADINGYPMIWWMHKHAKEVDVFDEVYVRLIRKEFAMCAKTLALRFMSSKDYELRLNGYMRI